MNKKGFTLIELLAVIVILAVIVFISTPLIMNVIATSRRNADRVSAQNYIKSIETTLTEAVLEYPNLIIGSGIENATGDDTRVWPCEQCSSDGTVDIKFSGTEPKKVTLEYNADTGRITGKLAYTNGCWKVDEKGNLESLKEPDFYNSCK